MIFCAIILGLICCSCRESESEDVDVEGSSDDSDSDGMPDSGVNVQEPQINVKSGWISS